MLQIFYLTNLKKNTKLFLEIKLVKKELTRLITKNMEITSDNDNVSFTMEPPKPEPAKEPLRINLFIAVPCYGDSVMTPFMHSISELCKELEKRNIRFNFVTVSTESLITRARNGLMSNFLSQKKHTHLFFIDSDIEFDAISVVKLLVADKDVVGGIYPLKRINEGKLKENAELYRKEKNLSIDHEFTDDEVKFISSKSLSYAFTPEKSTMNMQNHCIEVTDIATGFMMIKRHVIEKMVDRYPELEYQPFKNDQYGTGIKYYAFFDTMIHPDTGIYLSEDYAFCKRWVDMGGKIHIRTDIDLTHIGQNYYKGNVRLRLTSNGAKTVSLPVEELKKAVEDVENEFNEKTED